MTIIAFWSCGLRQMTVDNGDNGENVDNGDYGDDGDNFDNGNKLS